MQLVFDDVLKRKPWVLKNIKTYFSAMKSMNCGKASTIFQEKAEELENMVLTNKTFQKTRFVRALQRGNTAALRNLPTIHHVIGEEYTEAHKEGNTTRYNQLGKLMDTLQNFETLVFAIGIAQLLEPYCDASLEVQHAFHFPIQVCSTTFPAPVLQKPSLRNAMETITIIAQCNGNNYHFFCKYVFMKKKS